MDLQPVRKSVKVIRLLCNGTFRCEDFIDPVNNLTDKIWIGRLSGFNEMKHPLDIDFHIGNMDNIHIQMVFNFKHKLFAINYQALRILLDNFKYELPAVSYKMLCSNTVTTFEAANEYLSLAPRGDVYFLGYVKDKSTKLDELVNITTEMFLKIWPNLFREQMPYTKTREIHHLVHPAYVPRFIALRPDKLTDDLVSRILQEPARDNFTKCQENRVKLTLLAHLVYVLIGPITTSVKCIV